MKMSTKILALLIFTALTHGLPLAEERVVDLSANAELMLHNAAISHVDYKGNNAVKAEISAEASEQLAEIARQRQQAGAPPGPRSRQESAPSAASGKGPPSRPG